MDFLGGKAIRPIEARIKRGLQHLLIGQSGELAVVEPENRTVIADNASGKAICEP